MSTIEKSKWLARVLRHRPDSIKLKLDKQGWTPIAELLEKAQLAGVSITHAELLEIAATNDKRRFSLSPDGLRIRAAQGHSLPVDLRLPSRTPPPVLYHGTVARFLDSILKKGLLPQSRHDVHLSATAEIATEVGARRGTPVVLEVDSARMHRDGFEFRCSDNGVWLTSRVPPKYLQLYTG